jgi:hypothetical protein
MPHGHAYAHIPPRDRKLDLSPPVTDYANVYLEVGPDTMLARCRTACTGPDGRIIPVHRLGKLLHEESVVSITIETVSSFF